MGTRVYYRLIQEYNRDYVKDKLFDFDLDYNISNVFFDLDLGDLPSQDRKSVLQTYANSADSIRILQNGVPDQGLHCLLTGICIQSQSTTRNP